METKKWTEFKDIKANIERKWQKGDLLRSLLDEGSTFPYKIKLKGPSSSEAGLNFDKLICWVDNLKAKEKSRLGYGYEIVEKVVNFRLVGKNTVPTHVVIGDVEDALRLINKVREATIFRKNYEKIYDEWGEKAYFEDLKNWCLKYPFKVIEDLGDNISEFILVINWFERNLEHFLYIRQLDIEGVDTKFIEKHRETLGEMLEIILPSQSFDSSQKRFEDRFKLRKKPSMIRFRILDDEYKDLTFRDMTVPVEEFVAWKNTVERVFFTENEINFLSFPNLKNSIVIFGKGYGVQIFRDVKWLSEKEVYYWGDIDTHGFNILSMLRSFLPKVRSFLMTEKILMEHKALWVEEDNPFLSESENLIEEERNLMLKLQNKYFGKHVRLEQERIRFKFLEEWIKKHC